ncbi:MAG: hypothetical protein AAGC55_29020 [Myxococcota bacterium]
MRALKITVFTLVAAVLSTAAMSSPADAQRRSKAPRLEPIDVTELREHMVVLHDGDGHYVIATPVKDHYTTVFYGDGKKFYEQRTYGGGLDTGAKSMSASFWSPRDNQARLERVKGKWQMQCSKRETELKPLDEAEAGKLLDRARFYKHPWKHQAYTLARDDRGNYYYVDRLRDAYGGKGFRLWVGPRGNMKRMQMTNIVSDSEGDIFATKRGELRFITSKDEMTWVRGKRRRALVKVPVSRNVKLIYAELGVYLQDLYTPCDDM